MEFNGVNDEDDIKELTNDQEIDPYRVLIFDGNFNLLFEYRSPTFHGKDFNFVSFLEACQIVTNDDSEPLNFTDIQIVFSLKISNLLIDIASCREIFCISVSVDDPNRPVMKANPLNAICVLYSILNLNTSNELNLSCISFSNRILTDLFDVFSKLCEPQFAEYVSVVSSFNEVFCSFGQTKIPSGEYYEVWDEAMAIAAELEKSDQHVMSNSTDYLAVFSFLPCVKIVAIFSEEALKFPEPEEEEALIKANNENLMFPFMAKIDIVKSLIPKLYSEHTE